MSVPPPLRWRVCTKKIALMPFCQRLCASVSRIDALLLLRAAPLGPSSKVIKKRTGNDDTGAAASGSDPRQADNAKPLANTRHAAR